jgi:hypothetical protein
MLSGDCLVVASANQRPKADNQNCPLKHSLHLVLARPPARFAGTLRLPQELHFLGLKLALIYNQSLFIISAACSTATANSLSSSAFA